MIYKNDNIIEKDNYIIGTIEDLREYFRYQIASLCMTGEEEQEGFTTNVRDICDLLDILEEDLQLYPDYATIKVSRMQMGNFVIERED
jgi:hypothetical protein|nr:MAG TPA: hypothetical protein [Caudoviricetes sp.]